MISTQGEKSPTADLYVLGLLYWPEKIWTTRYHCRVQLGFCEAVFSLSGGGVVAKVSIQVLLCEFEEFHTCIRLAPAPHPHRAAFAVHRTAPHCIACSGAL